MKKNSRQWVSVYVICTLIDGVPQAPIKVGIARDPLQRIKGLQTGNPEKLFLYSEFHLPNRSMAELMEKMFHDLETKDFVRGEWSRMCPEKATNLIKMNITITHMGLAGAEFEHASEAAEACLSVYHLTEAVA